MSSARGPEAAFWRRVRDAWAWHAVKIRAEDGEADTGTPDVVLSRGGRGGWVELKVWPDNVNPKQLAWHIDARQRGAYCVVLSEMPDGSVWLGSAEEYDRMVNNVVLARMIRPKGKSVLMHGRSQGKTYASRWLAECVDLQTALHLIGCALTGTPRSQKG